MPAQGALRAGRPSPPRLPSVLGGAQISQGPGHGHDSISGDFSNSEDLHEQLCSLPWWGRLGGPGVPHWGVYHVLLGAVISGTGSPSVSSADSTSTDKGSKSGWRRWWESSFPPYIHTQSLLVCLWLFPRSPKQNPNSWAHGPILQVLYFYHVLRICYYKFNHMIFPQSSAPSHAPPPCPWLR